MWYAFLTYLDLTLYCIARGECSSHVGRPQPLYLSPRCARSVWGGHATSHMNMWYAFLTYLDLTLCCIARGECSSHVGRQGGPQPLYLSPRCARSVWGGHATSHMNMWYAFLTYLDLTLCCIARGECSSHVGRQGGPQPLYLSPRCARSVGVAMHEMLHTLGFTHEHMRPDRDKYVYINYSNIDYAYWKNFEIDSNVKLDDFGASYDFSSLMHYRLCAMSNNSLPTIIAKIKPRTKLIGQRIGFSEQDIIKLNRFYNCSLKANNAKVVLAESESILQTHDCDKNCDCSSRDGSESNAYPHSCVLKIILIVYTYKQLFPYTSVVNIFIFL
ncbi:zinc metalloproteinase nas-25-like [Macrosteles quadrilineatus]|uniref:zinc metalloproteinase nas-25-like n=1 Tax=Macrosteles quadrilineatus TaxID=74068 RepID=UPI0023E1E151|nr:zinc metalloproteinase nas-25-like [Macrosteles quadrilineatus]